MRRRSVLAAATLALSGGVGGCLAGPKTGGSETSDPDTTDPETGTPTASGTATASGTPDGQPAPDTYDRCPRLVIGIGELPEPVRREVETALAEGAYETDGELSLPHVLDPEASYLEPGGENGDRYYRATIDDRNSTMRLTLAEATPSMGPHPLSVESRFDESVSVDVQVTYRPTDEVVLEASQSVTPDERPTLGEFDRRLGEYRATVEAGSVSGPITWREAEHRDPLATVVVGPEGVRPEPRAVAELVSCTDFWEQ
ncbi:hypothetical protein [Halopenitus persicus]|uniref:Uncharacterized protein n=1 Tax=Halopenitus persicus TaxID=1048396 RepID=A0A1H3DU42_9EURY|nr:hypothetical protein [Halopenitus persicus]SDX69891.1 hypothetical protein SAMN05216564_101148 [Halopenitus persicus]